MSSNNPVLSVNNVSKCFYMYDRPADRLKDLIAPKLSFIPSLNKRKFHTEFWALKNVSFEVGKGECVGIIGQNGSGKSTLLQIIAGTMTPTTGHVDVQGKITALLELGSGFNPDFTGRENVYLNGCLLGLTQREIDEKFDWIASFADIGPHLEQPVKTYSSGMMLRLAFAVQASIDMQILIVDEALSVGDARFQLKCFKRLDELKNNGTTILFVSHAAELVRSLCSRGLLLNGGDVIYWGEAKVATSKYYEILFPKGEGTEDEEAVEESSDNEIIENTPELTDIDEVSCDDLNMTTLSLSKDDLKKTWGLGGALLDSVDIQGVGHPNVMQRGRKLNIKLQVVLDFNKVREIAEKEGCLKNLFVGIRFDNNRGMTIFDVFHEVSSNEMLILEQEKKCNLGLHFEIEIPDLALGNYFLTFGVAIGRSDHTLHQVVPLFSSDDVVMLTLEQDNSIHGLMKPTYKSKRIK